MEYLYKNVTSHDLGTLPDAKSLEKEPEIDPLREAYLKGVEDTSVALHALIDWLKRGKIDKAMKIRVIACESILFEDSFQYTHEKNYLEICEKYNVNQNAFYALRSNFKNNLNRIKNENKN